MMRRGLAGAFLAFAAGLTPLVAGAQTRFADDGGRSVMLPPRVERVMPAGPPASVDLLMLAPEKLVGLTRDLSPAQAAYLPARERSLHGIGRITGHGKAAVPDAAVKSAPDLIIDLGDVDDAYIALANRVQQQTGIPYVLLGGSLADTPATFRKLGTILGAESRAALLARYAEETLRLVKARVASVPPDQRPSVYLARGSRGLQTGLPGSLTGEVLDLAGARNVATAGPGAHGLVDVSIAQLVAWQPDYIIVVDPGLYRAVWHEASWQKLAAVQKKHVYLAPAWPFGWADEPPAANRLLGLRWLAKLLYPARFPEDIRAEARRFYALFYGRAPDDAQLDALLAGAKPPS